MPRGEGVDQPLAVHDGVRLVEAGGEHGEHAGQLGGEHGLDLEAGELVLAGAEQLEERVDGARVLGARRVDQSVEAEAVEAAQQVGAEAVDGHVRAKDASTAGQSGGGPHPGGQDARVSRFSMQ